MIWPRPPRPEKRLSVQLQVGYEVMVFMMKEFLFGRTLPSMHCLQYSIESSFTNEYGSILLGPRLLPRSIFYSYPCLCPFLLPSQHLLEPLLRALNFPFSTTPFSQRSKDIYPSYGFSIALMIHGVEGNQSSRINFRVFSQDTKPQLSHRVHTSLLHRLKLAFGERGVKGR